MINEKIKPFYIGRKTIKKIKGESVEMIPFLYTSSGFNQIGIGIQNSSGEGLMWGLHSPITIIRWWRCLKILESLDTIENNTLALCWKITVEDYESFKVLAMQTGGDKSFRIVLNKIFNTAPTQTELTGMIQNLRSKGIEVNYRELQTEIDKGAITSSPIIESVIGKALHYESKYEKAKTPLPREHRLNLFFTGLGIESICNEDGDILDLYFLDLIVKRHCIGNKKIQSYLLFADENGDTKPTYLSFTGTLYVFDSVKFCKGRFYVKTKINIPNQKETVGEYTLAELREKIGPITLANFPKVREVLSTLITCFR